MPGSPPPVPTRERILDASKELFAHQGYHGSSIRDIAGVLSVSVSAVYNHFPSKDAILAEVLRRPIAQSTDVVMADLAVSESCDPMERLARCLAIHFRYLIDHKLDAELINSEYLRLSDEARASIVSQRNAYEETFRQLILACLPESRRIPRPPEASVAMNILLGLTGNNHRWFREGGAMNKEQMVGFYVQFALGGIRATLGVEPA